MSAVAAPLFLIALQGAAPSAPATPTVAPKVSRQQAFDAASKAAADGKCAEAVKAFEEIEATTPAKPNSTVDAVIKIRKGYCLAGLKRGDEAEAAMRAGLAVLEPLGETFEGDVYQARLTLGQMAYLRFDFATAREEARRALALTKDAARVEPLLLLARITMFDGGSEALGYADEALKLVGQRTGPQAKESIAVVQTIHARVLLNQGRFKEAYAELRKALEMQGGLGLKIRLTDMVTRSDLAIAALLSGDRDNARKYLAYTGAGRMKDSPFGRAASMETPPCGGDIGLRPGDNTIVEFSLADDGSVASAIPIYSTGRREVALQFARAVSRWSWRPQDIAAIPQFYRFATRVSLRCSTQSERPGVMSGLAGQFAKWIGPHAVHATSEIMNQAEIFALATAELDRRKAVSDRIGQVAALSVLGNNPNLTTEVRRAYLAEASRLAGLEKAPVAARTFLALLTLQTFDYSYKGNRAATTGLRALLADPETATDALSGATLRLMLAQSDFRKSAPDDADALLAAVVADSRLPADDPLRINALLLQASRAARAGDQPGAQAAFAKTGLDAEQCALIGARPAVRSTGISSDDFPDSAMQWGFEGWTYAEFDILADGKTTNQRATIAYPPFVFEDAATGIVKGIKYETSYRPGGGSACNGAGRTLIFRLP